MNDCPSDSEEEILVYAEFKDSVKIEKYRNIHVLGIDRKTPLLQLDDTFFTGIEMKSYNKHEFIGYKQTMRSQQK